MSLILLAFGILITGAGGVAIVFGVPMSDSALGQTLMTSGAIGAVGGPMLMGVGAVVTQLNAIAEALRVRPAAQIPRLTDARQPSDGQRRPEAVETARPPDPRPPDPRLPEPRLPEPRPAEPTPAAAIEVSGSALERLRSSAVRPDRVVTNGEEVPLSPNGHHAGAEGKSLPKPEPEARPGGASEPRLDFLFRPKAPRPPHSEPFDAMWPKRRGPVDQPRPDEVARQSPPSSPPNAEPRAPAEREPRSVAILKSGVVDGMAYTLYADGSIEAQLPHGTVRFGSIAELRAHIENNS
jgi:hypothetical protein